MSLSPIARAVSLQCPEVATLIARAFASRLGSSDVHALLAYLNGLTEHRFTGVYRFEAGWVRSVALWDREKPDTQVGADVRMEASYCWLTGLDGAGYVIEDATRDARLDGHPARHTVRSYLSVALRDHAGMLWGTLCHFDFVARPAAADTCERLEALRPLIQEMLVRDSASGWRPQS